MLIFSLITKIIKYFLLQFQFMCMLVELSTITNNVLELMQSFTMLLPNCLWMMLLLVCVWLTTFSPVERSLYQEIKSSCLFYIDIESKVSMTNPGSSIYLAFLGVKTQPGRWLMMWAKVSHCIHHFPKQGHKGEPNKLINKQNEKERMP